MYTEHFVHVPFFEVYTEQQKYTGNIDNTIVSLDEIKFRHVLKRMG